MTVAHGKPKYTIEDYMRLPEGERVELIGGELLVSPAPRTKHQAILGRLYRKLADQVEFHHMGEVFLSPTDVVLSRHDVVQPDLLFISNARASIVTEANIQGAPDLVIEILSPGCEKRDQVAKKALYARHGVKEYWIVDPDAESVQIYVLDGKSFSLKKTYSRNELLQSVNFLGLRLPLQEIFK